MVYHVDYLLYSCHATQQFSIKVGHPTRRSVAAWHPGTQHSQWLVDTLHGVAE